MRAIAERIVARLRSAGHEALLAGGCVRDLILGRTPLDWDVATSAQAVEVQRLFRRTVPVGVQFGVVLVLEEDARIEVATFRRDGRYLDHRHPVAVELADPRADASRRDFTINGMFLDPASGQVIDYVGGRDDLEAGVIRAIGDPQARFDEDRLRLLRAVRLAARFGYAIEPATRAAIERLAREVTTIAWERIGEEIAKILGEGRAREGFELLEATGLLAAILPEVAALRGVAQPPEHHPEGDVLTHTLLALAHIEPGRHDEALSLAVLLHDVAKPACAATQPGGRITFHGHCERGAEIAFDICMRLRRSRATAERVAWLVRFHLRHLDAPRMRVATLRRLLAEPWIEDLLELVRIDSLAGSGDLRAYELCRARLRELPVAERRPERLLKGRDLVDLGYLPGPDFRRILEAALDAQLEGAVRSPEEARAWALEHHPPGPGCAER